MKTILTFVVAILLTYSNQSWSQTGNSNMTVTTSEDNQAVETTETNQSTKDKKRFMDNVRFGGTIYLGFGSDSYTIGAAPSAVYDFNKYFSAGASISYIYSKGETSRIDYTRNMYGASAIALFNPISNIQLSAEYEQMHVNYSSDLNNDYNYWVPALYLGAAYRIKNFAAGVRYDVLYDEQESIYASEWTPFFRIYF